MMATNVLCTKLIILPVFTFSKLQRQENNKIIPLKFLIFRYHSIIIGLFWHIFKQIIKNHIIKFQNV